MNMSDITALRNRTGVGITDCKKALEATGGDIDKAVEYLREKGIASAAKKADRIAAEGIVDSYIHLGGRVGVLLEVNCETDFVARGDKFKALVNDIALHIAAAKPEYVSVNDIPAETIEKEKKILREQALNEPKPKPANVIEKMVEGRLNKFYEESVLLQQKYIKNPDITINDLIGEATSAIGEKISVRRFVRYELGEGIEKRKDNLADEISKMTQK